MHDFLVSFVAVNHLFIWCLNYIAQLPCLVWPELSDHLSILVLIIEHIRRFISLWFFLSWLWIMNWGWDYATDFFGIIAGSPLFRPQWSTKFANAAPTSWCQLVSSVGLPRLSERHTIWLESERTVIPIHKGLWRLMLGTFRDCRTLTHYWSGRFEIMASAATC